MTVVKLSSKMCGNTLSCTYVNKDNKSAQINSIKPFQHNFFLSFFLISFDRSMDFDGVLRSAYGAWESSYRWYLFSEEEIDELAGMPLFEVKKLYIKAKFALKFFQKFKRNELRHLNGCGFVSLYHVPVPTYALPTLFKFVAPTLDFDRDTEYSHVPAGIFFLPAFLFSMAKKCPHTFICIFFQTLRKEACVSLSAGTTSSAKTL